ncbi:hypothetical protein [Chryseobacterium sp. KCF3-3]|uniref:hypothetical protein n=1 Tax=Chryseobacterium sp. KCF3-3 TaxID=3231511 RepID=UPI0038B25003
MNDTIIIGNNTKADELEEFYKMLEEKYGEVFSRVPPPLEKSFSELLEEIATASSSLEKFNHSAIRIDRNNRNSVNPNERNYRNKRKW